MAKPLFADVVEVGELVEDQHARDAVVARQPPVSIHAAQQGWVGHEPPRLVVHNPPLAAVGVE